MLDLGTKTMRAPPAEGQQELHMVQHMVQRDHPPLSCRARNVIAFLNDVVKNYTPTESPSSTLNAKAAL